MSMRLLVLAGAVGLGLLVGCSEKKDPEPVVKKAGNQRGGPTADPNAKK